MLETALPSKVAKPTETEVELAGFTVTVNVAVELTVSIAASLTENCRSFVFQRIEPNRPGTPGPPPTPANNNEHGDESKH